MIFDTTDKIETPKSRYSKLKGDFRRMYLSPRAWNHEYGSRQNVQVYQDLLYYLDKAIQVRDHPALDILTDNINLVLQYLPISPRRREEHIAFIVSWLTNRQTAKDQDVFGKGEDKKRNGL